MIKEVSTQPDLAQCLMGALSRIILINKILHVFIYNYYKLNQLIRFNSHNRPQQLR